jgi:hypothetical protein
LARQNSKFHISKHRLIDLALGAKVIDVPECFTEEAVQGIYGARFPGD